MKEKQEIHRIEIGIIQLVVVVFAAMVASKIPYTEITQGSIAFLGVVHVVSSISVVIMKILSIEATWMNSLQLSNIVSYLL